MTANVEGSVEPSLTTTISNDWFCLAEHACDRLVEELAVVEDGDDD